MTNISMIDALLSTLTFTIAFLCWGLAVDARVNGEPVKTFVFLLLASTFAMFGAVASQQVLK